MNGPKPDKLVAVHLGYFLSTGLDCTITFNNLEQITHFRNLYRTNTQQMCYSLKGERDKKKKQQSTFDIIIPLFVCR